MSLATGLVPGLIATGATLLGAWCYPQRLHAGATTNHRGKQVPLTLGFAMTSGYLLALLPFAARVFGSDPAQRKTGFAAMWLVVCLGAVFAAGVYDDRRPARVHGLRAHFAEVLRGRITSGIVKLLVVAAAASIAAIAVGAEGWELVAGIPLIAGVTNLSNLLDVAPGRALKFGLVTSLILLVFRGSLPAWATAGSAAVLLPLDVRERGMLGDAGANTLGFVLGVQLLLQLPLWGLGTACGVVLLLHGLAETVTLSRIIRRIAALRWLDDLGRIPVRGSGIG